MEGKFTRIWENIITGELSDNSVDKYYEPTNLVFDNKTKVVYYKISELIKVYSRNFDNQKPKDTKAGYMSPYISENGKYCRFIDKRRIVEIK